MEHLLDDKTSLTKLIQILFGTLGIFQFFFDGCRPYKCLDVEVKKAGFASVDAKRFRLDLKEGVPAGCWAVFIAAPHFYGVATTASK